MSVTMLSRSRTCLALAWPRRPKFVGELLGLVGVMSSLACGPGSPADDAAADVETGSETSTDAETSTTSEPGDGDGPVEACSCVVIDRICTDDDAEAMNDCALPSPCATVDGSAEAAECVLGLLVAGEPARFEYDVEDPSCGFSCETWQGWFYILGPGQGLDNECHTIINDLSISETPSARSYSIAEPAYFADCIGKTASVMTGCIFNGLTEQDSIPECM